MLLDLKTSSGDPRKGTLTVIEVDDLGAETSSLFTGSIDKSISSQFVTFIEDKTKTPIMLPKNAVNTGRFQSTPLMSDSKKRLLQLIASK